MSEIEEYIDKELIGMLLLILLLLPLSGLSKGIGGLLVGTFAYILIIIVGAVVIIMLEKTDQLLETQSEPEIKTDPISELQRQYAAGEITHSEFENRLDVIIDSQKQVEDSEIDVAELDLSIQDEK